MQSSLIAYCGVAAVPGDLFMRWNIDPMVIAALAALGWLLVRTRSSHPVAGGAAIALMAVVFISPLCALSSALFSARVLHHVILVSAVAPLLALAFPQRSTSSLPLALLVAAHALVLWTWHAPGPYQWGLASVPGYWLMQLTLLGSGWLMWRAILAPATHVGPALIALATTIGQMGLLGALLVFASAPLYAVHLASTEAWGFSPLADQQLAGLLMWVPAMLPYLGAGLWMAWHSLKGAESAEPAKASA